jgi:hypothetical protein
VSTVPAKLSVIEPDESTAITKRGLTWAAALEVKPIRNKTNQGVAEKHRSRMQPLDTSQDWEWQQI